MAPVRIPQTKKWSRNRQLRRANQRVIHFESLESRRLLAATAWDDNGADTMLTARDNAYETTRETGFIEGNVILDDTGQGVDGRQQGERYHLIEINGQTPVFGSPLHLPSGSVISFGNDGTFEFLARPDFVGQDTFTYRISDGATESNLARVTISSEGDDAGASIRLVSAPEEPIPVGTPLVLVASAFDASGDSLSTAIRWESSLNGPLGAGEILVASLLSPGVHSISASVMDATGRLVSASTEILVNGGVDPQGTVQLSDEGELQIRGTDGDDVVVILPHRDSIRVYTRFGGERPSFESIDGDVNRVHVDLIGGDDTAYMHRNLMLPAVLLGGDGDDRLIGGIGDDFIRGGKGDDFEFGGGGDDDIYDIFGDNRLFGGPGDDRTTTGRGNDQIDLGPGDNIANDLGGDNIIRGGRQSDKIHSGPGNDSIWAGAGDDIVTAGEGANRVHGGRGNDRITTGDGPDRVRSGSGNDVVFTSGGRDYVSGGNGNDLLWTGKGDDLVFGGAGRDLMIGGVGADWMAGDFGGDLILGGEISADVRIDDLLDAFDDWQNCRDIATCGASVLDTLVAMDDRDADVIFGGPGQDYLQEGLDDRLLAAAADLSSAAAAIKFTFDGQNGQQLQQVIDAAPDKSIICVVGQHVIPEGVSIVGKHITLVGVGDARLSGSRSAKAVISVYGGGELSVMHLVIDANGTVGIGAGRDFRPRVLPPGEPPVSTGHLQDDLPGGQQQQDAAPAPERKLVSLAHVTIEDAAVGLQALEYQIRVTKSSVATQSRATGIRITKGHFQITNSTIAGGSYGIHILDSPGTSEQNRIVNVTVGATDHYGILAQRSGLLVLNSLVVWNERGGIAATASALLVQGTHVMSNYTAGIQSEQSRMQIFDSKIALTKSSRLQETFGKFGDGVVARLGDAQSWIKHTLIDHSDRASVYVESGHLELAWNEFRCDQFDIVSDAADGQSPPLINLKSIEVTLPAQQLVHHISQYGVPASELVVLTLFGLEDYRKLLTQQYNVPHFSNATVDGKLYFFVPPAQPAIQTNYCECTGSPTHQVQVLGFSKQLDGRLGWQLKVDPPCDKSSSSLEAPKPLMPNS